MTGSKPARRIIARPRYVLFFAVLLAAPWPLLTILPLDEALVAAFDLAALAFLGSMIGPWRHGTPEAMRRQAARDDAGRLLVLLLCATIVIVVTVVMARLIIDQDALDAWRIVLLVGTLLEGWMFTNLVFAIHYAHLFYDSAQAGGDSGGLDFPGGEEPVFSDFVNFSFVIGMTCQTADIAITSASARRVATFHGLFAFIFNLGILALTVNVIAGSG